MWWIRSVPGRVYVGVDIRAFRFVTAQTVLAEAHLRAEANSASPCPERLAVLADEYIAAQLEVARRERQA